MVLEPQEQLMGQASSERLPALVKYVELEQQVGIWYTEFVTCMLACWIASGAPGVPAIQLISGPALVKYVDLQQ
jgi:hypothetical protein